jgi:hypothetical protein
MFVYAPAQRVLVLSVTTSHSPLFGMVTVHAILCIDGLFILVSAASPLRASHAL